MTFYHTVISPSTKDILSAHPKCQQLPRQLNIGQYTLLPKLTSTRNEPEALTHTDDNQHQVFFHVTQREGLPPLVVLQIQ
jgi:hypothetical protein